MKEKKMIWVLLGCAVIIGVVAAILYGMKGKKQPMRKYDYSNVCAVWGRFPYIC